jgi:hypothetical protein
MLSEQDRQWLLERYPELLASADRVEGSITFRATYNKNTNQFQIIYPGDSNLVGGCELAGTFTVTMEARLGGEIPRIPSLKIDGHHHNKDRHIDADEIACLCSPFVESEYLVPQLNGQRFIEELVVPFLYGQLFYEEHKSWPWTDYAHGFAGLMESYTPTQSKEEFLKRLPFLAFYPLEWQKVRGLISQRKAPTASSPCICGSRCRIGHCHLRALKGILALRDDRKKHRELS